MMPVIRTCFFAVLVLSGVLLLPVPDAVAQNLTDTKWDLRPLSLAVARETYQDVDIVGMPLPPESDYDIPLADPAATVAKIKAALARVLKLSKVSAAGIDRLRQHGTVRIIYDAAFPPRTLSRVIIAAFAAREYTPQRGKKSFTVIVGRFGANWEVPELAAVLVHELIGHGIQRLRNRIGNDRPIDLECEARLWQELYYIDARMPLDTREMVSFRNTTNRRVCNDFRRFIAKAAPKLMQDWDRGNPDMPRLLAVFQQYFDLVRKARQRRGK